MGNMSGVICSGGTGQIISRLVNDEIDVAIALTDPLLAGIAKGSSNGAYKLVGSYLMTPLNWAVVTGKDSKYQNIADLRGTAMGISRIGRLVVNFGIIFPADSRIFLRSGSHTMANVMALQHGEYTGRFCGILTLSLHLQAGRIR